MIADMHVQSPDALDGEDANSKAAGSELQPRIYFVRHGRSTHNESDEDRPLIWDAPLHEKGIRQAELLRAKFQDLRLDVVVSSPLTRALQTALIALGADEGADDAVGKPKRRRCEPRCPVVAWPDATEQLHESDDLGSPALELRLRFPSVDFGRLPQDGSTWWWQDPALPGTTDAMGARQVWQDFGRGGPSSTKQHRYDEPDDRFRERVAELLRGLDKLVCGHSHVAVFAHCWVLEEIWRQRFGRGRRFANAELAVVAAPPDEAWRWIKGGEESESSSGS